MNTDIQTLKEIKELTLAWYDLFVGVWDAGTNIEVLGKKIYERVEEMNKVSQEVPRAIQKIEEVLKTIQIIQQLFVETEKEMKSSHTSFLKWDTTFKTIHESLQMSEERSKNLKNSIDQSTQFIVSTQHITKEINLLSLNAAILASRAGKKGSAFSVIAQEVKKMSFQAKYVNQEINQTIREVWDDTEEIIKKIKNMADNFQENVEKNKKMKADFEELLKISHSTTQQLKDFSHSHYRLEKQMNDLKVLIQVIIRFTLEFQEITQFLEELASGQEKIIFKQLEDAKNSIMKINSVPENIQEIKKNWNTINQITYDVWHKETSNIKFVETIKKAVLDAEKTVDTIIEIRGHVNQLKIEGTQLHQNQKDVQAKNENLQFSLHDFILSHSANQEKLKNIDESIRSLQEKMKKIRKYIQELKSISEQIDFLSIHASIEATRIINRNENTEFHQVASEIKKLADNSQKSTDKIKKIFENIEKQIFFFQDSIQDAQEKTKQQIEENNKINIILQQMTNKFKQKLNDLDEMVQTYENLIKKIENVENGTKNVYLFASDFAIVGDEIVEIAWFQLIREMDYERFKVKLINLVDQLEQDINHNDKQMNENVL